MVVKTAIGSPDEGPKKKGYGIPDKDKKGLKPKNDYKSMGETREARNHSNELPAKKEDLDYEKFKQDYIKHKSHLDKQRYNGYQAPDGSWHGHPLSESAIKAHHKWSKMTREQQQKHTEREKQHRNMMNKRPDKQHEQQLPKPKELPKTSKPGWDHPSPKTPASRLQDELKKKSSSVKVVKNAIKKPEDKEKEKANKLKKKSPTSRARALLSKTKKKKNK
jgi:hypothetical protein